MSEFKTTPMLNSWELRVKRLEEVLDAKDAAIASLTRELDKAKEGLAAAIIHAGLATGHGDTVDDLLQELREQVARLTQELEEARGKVGQIITALNGEHLTREAIHKIEQILGGGE